MLEMYNGTPPNLKASKIRQHGGSMSYLEWQVSKQKARRYMTYTYKNRPIVEWMLLASYIKNQFASSRLVVDFAP